MALVSSISVSLRIYIQLSGMLFWWDDGLMLIALIMYVANVGIVCRSVQLGFGASSTNIPNSVQVDGRKYATIWFLVYTACLVTVKASICLTMLRMGKSTRYIRLTVYILLLTSLGSFLVGFIDLLTFCNPTEAIWNPRLVIEGRATCKGKDISLVIIYTSAVMTIVTDVACTVLPAVMLWNTQLKLKKLLVTLILLFGLIASICTVIRALSIEQYAEDGGLFSTLNTMLLSNVETAIGLIIGSSPVLQKIILSCPRKREPVISCKTSCSMPFDGVPVKSRNDWEGLSNPFDKGSNVTTISASRRSRDWDRMKGGLDLHFIRADYTFEVRRSEPSIELVETASVK
ncbi:hypothetical protein K445DRAFT_24383 [Daldinia sp. EC12]|nr:hypothetical protein K445DRAFT_24383 [Daldinia sp. EC12]